MTRAQLLLELSSMGWMTSSPTLKIPHATSPCGKFRLWLQPKAIHISVNYAGGSHHKSWARSLGVDAHLLTTHDIVALAMKKRPL